MSTATDKDTRLFRFGAIVPEEHQELALRLAELEDRLNGAFASEEEPWKPIYFIPTIVDSLSDLTTNSVQPEEDFIANEREEVVIRKYCEADLKAIKQTLLDGLLESGDFSEEYILNLKEQLALADS